MSTFLIPIEGIEDDVLEESIDIFEHFRLESEHLTLQLKKAAFNLRSIQHLKNLFTEVLHQFIKLNLAPFTESLEELVKIFDKLIQWRIYPERMSELILMVNDRILILVRDLSQTKAIDMRKTQQILVALQYIILVESVAQLQEGVEKSIKTISKTICQDTEANENVTLFDDDIDLFDDDDDDIDLFSEDMTSATQKTGHSPEIFIPEASLNPVLQAKEFIALEMTNEAVNLLSLISDGAAGANSKHTELLLELCLSCNIINGNTIDNKELSMGIAFHDIAMAANTAIFNKDGRLTAEELQILRQHPIEGLKLLKHFDQSETASQTVLEHHERYDGSGYPNQLKADQISDAGKLLGIVDSFHAMISHRAHKKYAKDMLRAVSEINACSDTLYDPRWVSTFNTCLRQYWLPMHNKLALR